MNRRGLGRGLGALLSATPTADDILLEVPLDQIEGSQSQPRKFFNPETLDELPDSIRASGGIQPGILRRRGAGYKPLAGGGRWGAARQARLRELPALRRDAR